MAGLRERQKELRRDAILKAAMQLFAEHGFTNTTVENIAELAGVSTPTVFNYFGSKQVILLELADKADKQALADARLLIPHFDNAIDPIYHLGKLIVDHELKVLPPAIWRELINHAFREDASEALTSISERLLTETTLLLDELQKRKLINQEADIQYASYLFNDYCTFLFIKFVQQDKPDIEKHYNSIRKLVETVFHGLAPTT